MNTFSVGDVKISRLCACAWKISIRYQEEKKIFIIKTTGANKNQHHTEKEYNNLLTLKDLLKDTSITKSIPNIHAYHPNGIPELSSIIPINTPTLVLDYIPGQDLFEIIEALILTPDLIIKIFRAVVKILASVHNIGIYHRDIKPENIIVSFRSSVVDTEDQPKETPEIVPKTTIIDWEFAESVTKSVSYGCGTVFYVAPEMIKSPHIYSTCNDVWALGVVLYAMYTNRLPFPEKNTLEHILNSPIEYNIPTLPSDAVVFLKKIFTSYKQRITLKQALDDRFLAE